MNAQDCERYCKSAMSVLIVDMRALKEQVNVLWEPLNKSLRLFLPAQGFSAVVLEENQSLSTGSGLFDRRCGLKDAKFASQNKEKSPFRSTTAMVLTMRSFSIKASSQM